MGNRGAVRRTGASQGWGRGHWAAPTRGPIHPLCPHPTTAPCIPRCTSCSPAPTYPWSQGSYPTEALGSASLSDPAPGLWRRSRRPQLQPTALTSVCSSRGPNARVWGLLGVPHLNLQQEGVLLLPHSHPHPPPPLGADQRHNKGRRPQLALKNSPRTELETLHRSLNPLRPQFPLWLEEWELLDFMVSAT